MVVKYFDVQINIECKFFRTSMVSVDNKKLYLILYKTKLTLFSKQDFENC